MSDEQEDNHCAEGDGREIGEEQEKGAGGWSGQIAGSQDAASRQWRN